MPVAAAAQTPPRPDLTSLSGGVTQLYQSTRRNVLEAAEAMPEGHYVFKPTDDVRTFGPIIGHVVNTHYNFCTAGGSTATRTMTGNAEQMYTTKADLVTALRMSFEFCDAAYAAATDQALLTASRFGQAEITTGYALVFNVAHDNEHYGNLVTYMRLKGLVPPSTARTRR
ncbi:MAG TPA: DinB family protein [Vicinamibacterales bacterium]|nr:DinB family protein [Vicinamibacterales bacterium]